MDVKGLILPAGYLKLKMYSVLWDQCCSLTTNKFQIYNIKSPDCKVAVIIKVS